MRSKADLDLVARRGGQLVSFSEMCRSHKIKFAVNCKGHPAHGVTGA
jgi:hypothetical protein